MYRFQSAARSDDAQLFSEHVLSYADQLALPGSSALHCCQPYTSTIADCRRDPPQAQVTGPMTGEQPSVRQWQHSGHLRPAAAGFDCDWQWQRDSGASSAVLNFQQQSASVFGSASSSLPSVLAPEWQSPTGERILNQQRALRQQSIQQQLSFSDLSTPASSAGNRHRIASYQIAHAYAVTAIGVWQVCAIFCRRLACSDACRHTMLLLLVA